MAWDDELNDGFFIEGEEGLHSIDAEEEAEFVLDSDQDELDYELYEQEKENADSDDFPETFEEWKIMKDQEQWNLEDEMVDSELMEEYEE